jgi:O-acetyl-ADP-ribose deacetylase (regulator of RNase III)
MNCMAKKYFLATRPEIIASIVKAGKLPDRLPKWMNGRMLSLFETLVQCIKFAATMPNFIPDQSFILEICIPEIIVSSNKILALEQIDITWIKSVLVYSLRGKNLLYHLLECPIDICINQQPFFEALPQLFCEGKKEKIQENKLSALEQLTLACKDEHKLSSIIIHVQKGSLFNSKMQTLINTVNCVGIMGKGIALEFRKQYPEMYIEYAQKCKQKQVKLGEPYLYKVNDKRWILNFPTKGHWKDNSRIEDIETGLIYLAFHIKSWGITSLAIPPLGCGNGGLNWNEVKPLIEKYLGMLNIQMEIYSPESYLAIQPVAANKVNHKRPHSFISTSFKQSIDHNKFSNEENLKTNKWEPL